MRAGNNSIETCKAMKDGDGLRIREDLPRVVEQGYESLTQEQKQLLKWVGVFFREPTPGRFMMRIRMRNGFTHSEQLRANADVSRQDGNPEFTNLPRKFNVTVTGCLDNCTHNESQDIALVPARVGERAGFNILAGGKMGSGGFTPAAALNVFVEAHEAARTVAELIRIYRDYGPRDTRTRCRLAFLIEEWGIDRLRQELAARLRRELEPAGKDMRRSGHAD